MFEIEVDESYIVLNKGERLTPKELMSKWSDSGKNDEIIEIEHFHLFKPEHLEVTDIEPNHIQTSIKEITDKFNVFKYYASYTIEFTDGQKLHCPSTYKLVLYEGKYTDLNATPYEIEEFPDYTSFTFKTPTNVTTIKQFRDYILSKDRVASILVNKLMPGMKVVGVEYVNDVSKTKLFTVKTVGFNNKPFNYIGFDINPIDKFVFGKSNEHFLVVNNILVNYGGKNV